jgi:hypothetical protein
LDFNVSVDLIVPNITLISPADATSGTTNAYNFTFNVSDGSVVSNCSLVYDGSISNNITSVVRNAVNGIYKSSLSVGSHIWSINCTDIFGNEGNSSSRSLVVGSSTSSSLVASPGGSSGVSGAFSKEFSVSEDFFVVRSVVGDSKVRKFKIKNLGTGFLYVHLGLEGDDIEDNGMVKGFDEIVSLSERVFYLRGGEEKEISVDIVAPEDLGVYLGKVVVNGEKEILITINTQSKETLFDISSTPLENVVEVGGNLKTQMYLLPVGEEGVDVTVKYLIRDYSGEVYYEESSTFYVDEEMSFVKEFNTSDLAVGNYILVAEMVYLGGFASASSYFEVGSGIVYDESIENIYLVILIVGIIFAFVVVSIKLFKIRKYKKLKKK